MYLAVKLGISVLAKITIAFWSIPGINESLESLVVACTSQIIRQVVPEVDTEMCETISTKFYCVIMFLKYFVCSSGTMTGIAPWKKEEM